MRIKGRLHRSHSAEEATLEELIAMFCDPRKAQRAERRWTRYAKRHGVPG
jgi:hypothetical protein